MRGRVVQKHLNREPNANGAMPLMLLGICFFFGALSGFLFSALGDSNGELIDYLTRYFQAVGSGVGMETSFLAVLWDMFRWPVLIFLLGYTMIGSFGIPLLLAVRGFMLSYSIATFVRLFGTSGLAAALAAFGVVALLAVPAIFVVSHTSFCRALTHLPNVPAQTTSLMDEITAMIPAVGVLLLASALQRTVMSAVFSAVCVRLFSA